MKDLGGAVLVGLGGLGVLGGVFSIASGLFVGSAPSNDPQVGAVTGAARGAFIGTGLLTGAIGAAMVWGGLSLIRSE